MLVARLSRSYREGSSCNDVFGAVRASNGSGSLFGFTGEQTDPTTGFSYLRARHLDLTLDPFFPR